MARSSSLPQIPSLPSSNGDPTINGILSVLNPIKEILEIYQGNKGNSLGLDRVVRFNDIAILDPTTFSQTRASYARIVRVSGNIVRTGKIESTDSATYFNLDDNKLVFNGKINYASKMPGIFLGKDDDGTYKFNIGYDDKGSLKFDGVNTYLGLWSITPNGIGDDLTENASKIFLDKTNTAIRVGSAYSDYVTIDGTNVSVESSNYVSGVTGAGFHLDSDLLEVGNIACRGVFRSAVFQKDVVSAIGGNLMVRPADVLSEDLTELDVGAESAGIDLEQSLGDFLLEGSGGQALSETGGNFQLTIEGNETFAVDDLLRIKDGVDDEWFVVTDATNAPVYLLTRDQGGDYDPDDNPTWTKGATVVNYGQSGDGGVYMTASESNAPYLSIFTHAGSPWDTITTHLRLGNLNGFLGYSSDLYGIAIGSTNKYLKYDPTNHLRIQGNITVTGDNGFVKIYDAVPTERVRLGNLNGFLGYSSDLYGIAIGETNKSLTYDPTNGLVITGPGITAGALQSSDWAAALGVRLDLTNKYLKMGGSGVDGAGSAAGVFFGLDTLYKMYVGDGSNQYVQFDGVNLTVQGTIIITGGSGISSLTDAGALVTADDLDDVPNGPTYGKVKLTGISSGLIVVAGLDSGVTARMFSSGTVATNIEAWRHASDLTLIDGGDIYTDSITADAINVANLAAINADLGSITAGTLSSSNWAAAAGVRLDLTNKYLKMGGSNVTAAGAAAGIFLGLDTSYKFYVGDGSNEYFKYDGTNLALSTAKAGGITILSGGGMTVAQGGSITMTGGASGSPALIKFDDPAVPGEIRFYKSDDSSKYHRIYANNTNRQLTLAPYGFGDEVHTVQLGDGNIGYTDIFFVFNKDDDTPANNRVAIYLETGGSSSEIYGFYEDYVIPNPTLTRDFGQASIQWLDGYFYQVFQSADFFHLDSKDDLAELHKIKGSGVIDERTGLELIDDNSLPEWMLGKARKDIYGKSLEIEPDGINKKIKKELLHKKGDVMLNSNGAPYIPLSVAISHIWGCIKQLDKKVEAMRN